MRFGILYILCQVVEFLPVLCGYLTNYLRKIKSIEKKYTMKYSISYKLKKYILIVKFTGKNGMRLLEKLSDSLCGVLIYFQGACFVFFDIVTFMQCL